MPPPPDDQAAVPTAIVPSRPLPLAERFDLLARRLGDPLTRLFLLANHPDDPELQLRAAAELMPYRYPKLRAQEIRLDAPGGAIQFNINLGPAQPPAIDVTPKDPLD